ncbi:hypothetical protein JOD55_000327 [Arcanobacterium pluranimalium]|uniref:DUF1801 domain-containing protein n=1 Tax=Arcanobacterium pluranimalium TaxID=108028 RepID=UPI0019565718|nr:DUF1801 domain-containing protein [Arcanobacterium pluranimalium]MBM7824500.1 hypothetical protein [Arcanobacterium pluranimalium]
MANFALPLDPQTFLHSIPDLQVRRDCCELAQIMMRITGQSPVMWGPSIVGFGRLDRKENPHCMCDGLEVGFAPRSGKIFLYLRRYSHHYEDLIAQMGDVRKGRASIAFDSLSELDRDVLEDLITYAWEDCSISEE